MTAFEPVVLDWRPDMVLVVGDVNSTIACALVAGKLGVPVAHVEAGLRSFDRQMPEEINRILTDQLSDLLFVTEQSGIDNLRREGIADDKVFLVGNVMIDTLLAHRERRAALDVPGQRSGLAASRLRSAHAAPAEQRRRPVDARAAVRRDRRDRRRRAARLSGAPADPSGAGQLTSRFSAWSPSGRLRLIDPLGYLDFLGLMAASRVVLTDSGGIQEETTVLGVPCLTLRTNTERPVTTTEGTNLLVGTEPADIVAGWETVKAGTRGARIPPYWDGQAARRIVEIVLRHAAVPVAGAAVPAV